jgi:hypothetical protein
VKSRLLSRLEAEIHATANPLTADCLRCELVGYLARLGDIDKAALELLEVQKRYAARPHAALSAWLNLADALIGYHGNPEPLASKIANDKMKRAHAISAAVGMQPLQSIAAGWLAHLALERDDIVATVRFASEALRLARSDHHASRARATLVIAKSYHASGRLDLARAWYDRTQQHAIAEGDDVMLSALLWTTASQRVASLRQAQETSALSLDTTNGDPTNCDEKFADKSSEKGQREQREHTSLSCESTASFDKMRGVRGRHALQPILQAQLLTLLGKSDEALPLFETHSAAALSQGMQSSEAMLLADRAWCRLRAQQEPAARKDAQSALLCLEADMRWGHRAPAHSRLAQVLRTLGDADSASRHEHLAATAWKLHARDQRETVDALDHEFASKTAD